MKTVKARNDQLMGSVEITQDTFSNSMQRRVKIQNPNLRVIEWKPYPDCIPNSKNYYLVTVDYGKDDYGEYLETPEYFWGDEGWGKEYGDKIVAFAELPEPYKEKP